VTAIVTKNKVAPMAASAKAPPNKRVSRHHLAGSRLSMPPIPRFANEPGRTYHTEATKGEADGDAGALSA
jgi:hypothetical protein